MKRLKGSRSVQDLRLDMGKAGFPIGAGTLQRALKGETGNRLESLKKIADYAGTTVDQLLLFEGADESYWPFSTELQQKVLRLSDEELRRLENVMRGHLDMESVKVSLAVNNSQPSSGTKSDSAYAGLTEEGAGLPDNISVPAPSTHGGSQKVRRPARQKGRGGA